MSRLKDAIEDLNLSMHELRDPNSVTFGVAIRAAVRVIGNLAVTTAMAYDAANTPPRAESHAACENLLQDVMDELIWWTERRDLAATLEELERHQEALAELRVMCRR